MSRSRGVATPTPVTYSGHLADGQRSSTWRPALRRIKRELFSTKEVEQDRNIQSTGTFPPAEDEAASASGLREDQTSLLSRRGSRLKKCYTGINGAEKPREKPNGPREPHDSKGFNLIKRTFSRSKKSAPPSTHDIIDDGSAPREDAAVRDTGIPTGPPQAQRRVPRKEEVSEAPRPRTAGYIPQHARTDSIQQIRPLQPPANLSRHTNSYAPKNATSDFSSINTLPTIDPIQYNKFCHAHIQFERPSTVILSPHEPQQDSTDYQEFLEQSRKSAARPGRSRTEKESFSEVSRVMDDITARHRANARERAASISQASTKSRPGRPPSFVEKLGEYIKPTRPGSVYSQRSFFEGDDKSSLKGSVATGQERWERRWSRVGGSIRRSFSRDRDREGDERAGRHWALESENMGKRSRVMPVSRGLQKYNRAFAGF